MRGPARINVPMLLLLQATAGAVGLGEWCSRMRMTPSSLPARRAGTTEPHARHTCSRQLAPLRPFRLQRGSGISKRLHSKRNVPICKAYRQCEGAQCIERACSRCCRRSAAASAASQCRARSPRSQQFSPPPPGLDASSEPQRHSPPSDSTHKQQCLEPGSPQAPAAAPGQLQAAGAARGGGTGAGWQADECTGTARRGGGRPRGGDPPPTPSRRRAGPEEVRQQQRSASSGAGGPGAAAARRRRQRRARTRRGGGRPLVVATLLQHGRRAAGAGGHRAG